MGKQNRFKQSLDADGDHPLFSGYAHKERDGKLGNSTDGGIATSAYADQAASAGSAATARRMVESAHGSKVRATEAWVNGDMSSAQHAEVHKRADRVIKSKGALAIRTDAKGSKDKAKGMKIAGGDAGNRNAKPLKQSAHAIKRTNKAGSRGGAAR